MAQREWTARAITLIEADFNRSADTHPITVEMPSLPGIEVYFKDESSHPTGSLTHRLARSLFLYALANGWLHERGTVVEASSGSTAVSGAYFARLLGLPFVAVMPRWTSPDKIAAIKFYGGQCHLVDDGAAIRAESLRLAANGAATSWTSSPMPSAPPDPSSPFCVTTVTAMPTVTTTPPGMARRALAWRVPTRLCSRPWPVCRCAGLPAVAVVQGHGSARPAG